MQLAQGVSSAHTLYTGGDPTQATARLPRMKDFVYLGLLLAGCGLVVNGVRLWSPAMASVVAGGFCLGLAMVVSRSK